jgi:hypothetical protein
MSFQGRLLDKNEDPSIGSHLMVFKMFTVAGDGQGTPIWSSGKCTVITNRAGVFNVNLGAGVNSGSPDSDAAGNNLDNYNCGPTLGNVFTENSSIWIEITVNNEVLSPRQLIKSVPYALNAAALQGLSASASATANTIPIVNADGNLIFNTSSTAIVNTGDIYLIPGSQNLYVGTASASANLIVTGDASIGGQLSLTNVLVTDDGLNFKTKLGQNVFLSSRGYLGLGTTSPYQALSLKQNNIGFEFVSTDEMPNWSKGNDPLATESMGTGNLKPNAIYQYKITCVHDGKESHPSPAQSIDTNTSTKYKIKITTSDAIDCSTVRLYRSLADSDVYYRLGEYSNTGTLIEHEDNANDTDLALNLPLQEGGGIYAGGKLSLQFDPDGKLFINNRLKVSHGDNQGFQLPTSIGKPTRKEGQQAGDIVYDSQHQILYIYNGGEFVALSSTNSSNCAFNNCQIVIEPEYVGAIINGDGSDNTGVYTAGHELLTSGVNYNFVQWDSSETTLQDVNIVLNIPLPQNFNSWASTAINIDYQTNTTATTDNYLELKASAKNTHYSPSSNQYTSATAGQWTTATITAADLASLNVTANDTLTLTLTPHAANNNFVKLGKITIKYLSP